MHGNLLDSDDPILVSVIVLNFDGRDHLRPCIETLLAQTYEPLQIVVADDGSTDGSAAVAAGYAKVKWVSLPPNFGFADANNLSIAATNGAVLLFVNNDMRFDPRFVANLVAPLVERDDVFATDARQLDWAGKKEIHTATRLSRRPLRASWAPGAPILPRLAFEQFATNGPIEAVQACAANMAVRRDRFEELGGFDELMPAGWEDTDICWRAHLRGWKTVYVPGAVCWHHSGASSSSPEGSWWRYRGALGGRLRFAVKHLPAEAFLAVWAMVVLAGLRELLRADFKALGMRARVLGETVRHLPSAMAARRRLYRHAGTTPRRHLQRLTEIGAGGSGPGAALRAAGPGS